MVNPKKLFDMAAEGAFGKSVVTRGLPLYANVLTETGVAAPATAKPFRLITVVLPVEALLDTVICPVATPEAVGRNCTLSVAVWEGFKVSGKVLPDMLKPVPVKAAPPIVTGSVPVDVNSMDCVAEAFTTTS
jgi:hypothetical protein